MQTDRQLLFAVLAFQTDYISLAQLAFACRTWAKSKSRPIADLLVERGLLSAEDRKDIERQMERRLKRHGGNPNEMLVTLIDEPVRQAMEGVDDPDIQTTVQQLPTESRHLLVQTIAYRSDASTRYTLSKLHAEGGLGRVWLARDADLNREVALKELRPVRRQSQEASRRFLKEAQITGQLEHPNIVPVYELGHRATDDQPFYTMRFVRGRTLNAAIAQLHQSEPATRSLEMRQLLQALIAVCNAMAYAHSRGVMHRDLKPENIVLGNFGEVMVLDWGLAKVLGEPETQFAAVEIRDSPELTKQGMRLGTPSYMAPEQAEGRVDLMDARTDVYGLGAILFKILTGSRPYPVEDTDELLHRLVAEPTPQARSVAPSIPASLNAICLKAMAKERGDRYQNAMGLADDLQRWLADEPLSAYVDPWWDRVARWSRKHRTWTRAAAAALLATTAVSVVAAAAVESARRRTEDARDQELVAKHAAIHALRSESAARREALNHFKNARQAIDTHLTGVSEVLRYYPGVQQARERLLRQAVTDYERFAEIESDDRELQAEFARAYVRLGDVRVSLGELAEADEAYRKSFERFEDLLRLQSDDKTLICDVASSRTKRANALVARGNFATAEDEYQRVLALLEPYVTPAPETDDSASESLATTLVNYGLLFHTRGNPEQALGQIERALQVFADLAGRNPADRTRFGLASARRAQGEVFAFAGRYREAAESARRALDDLEWLERQRPDNPEFVEAAANARMLLASALMSLGHDHEELAVYENEIDSYAKLLAAQPDIPRYRELLGIAHNNKGQLLHRLDRNGEAEQALGLAHNTFAALTDSYRAVPQYQEELATTCSVLGQTLMDLGQVDQARLPSETAVAICRRLVQVYENPEYVERLAVSQAGLARWKHLSGDYGARDELYEETVSELRKLANAGSVVAGHQLASALADWAALLHDTGELRRVGELYDEAIAIRHELISKSDAADMAYHMAWLLVTCRDESRRDDARAVSEARRAVELLPESATYWSCLAIAGAMAQDEPTCLAAAEQALERSPAGHALPHLARAIVRAKSNPSEAQSHYETATAWMALHCPGNLTIKRIASEARDRLE